MVTGKVVRSRQTYLERENITRYTYTLIIDVTIGCDLNVNESNIKERKAFDM